MWHALIFAQLTCHAKLLYHPEHTFLICMKNECCKVINKLLTFPCWSTNPPVALRNMTFIGWRIWATLIAASFESTQSTWPEGASPTAVKTGMCPDLGQGKIMSGYCSTIASSSVTQLWTHSLLLSSSREVAFLARSEMFTYKSSWVHVLNEWHGAIATWIFLAQ